MICVQFLFSSNTFVYANDLCIHIYIYIYIYIALCIYSFLIFSTEINLSFHQIVLYIYIYIYKEILLNVTDNSYLNNFFCFSCEYI